MSRMKRRLTDSHIQQLEALKIKLPEAVFTSLYSVITHFNPKNRN